MRDGVDIHVDTFGVAVLADGEILAAGTASSIEGSIGSDDFESPGFGDVVAIRIEPDGQVDTGFGAGRSDIFTPGVVQIDRFESGYPGQFGTFTFGGLALEGDGGLLVEGASDGGVALARLGADGSIDPSFGIDGSGLARLALAPGNAFTPTGAFAIQADGRILPALGAFDIRPSDGSAGRIVPFGIAGAGQSLPAPADYFGTGSDDIAVYLASIGAFAIRNPAGGPDTMVPFGMPGDGRSIPIPGDYDGSGHDEIAVYDPNYASIAYRPANGGADVIRAFGAVGLATSLPAAAPAGAISSEVRAISGPTVSTKASEASLTVSSRSSVPAGPVATVRRAGRPVAVRALTGRTGPPRPVFEG